ncbi:MAG: GDSL-type esterase/lipase family protein [Planctomycetia bacterium]|nr:GDSL-type esterase/lipase family protein [Planctomycetia bacterium]
MRTQGKLLHIFAILALTLFLSTGTTSYSAERVLVVGDSITGHSMNLPYGYAHEVRAALEANGSDIEFIPLGGSGQTIFSWRGIIQSSYENRQRLDIQDIYVKDEFDKGADVILIHLGMNDALRPSIQTSEEGFATWKEEYRSLIKDLRARTPDVKRIVTTPPTLLTENPFAFKNELMDRFGEIIAEVSAEENCEFFDLRKEFKRHFLNARFESPEFRITLDFVHPNQAGHQVMAWGFLKALGLEEIADWYYKERVCDEVKAKTTPSATFFVADVPVKTPEILKTRENNSLTVPIVIDGVIQGVSKDNLSVSLPNGTTFKEISSAPDTQLEALGYQHVSIVLEGITSELPTDVTIRFGETERIVRINAPYFVSVGYAVTPFGKPEDFPQDQRNAIDEIALNNSDPLSLPASETQKITWFCYYPSADKTGANNPNAVDLADLTPANEFDIGYIVRYITSPKEQKCELKLNSEGFSTTAIETIYLNGTEVYSDILSPRHKKHEDKIEVELNEGLNIMTSRVGHTSWQWATSFDFQAEGLSY